MLFALAPATLLAQAKPAAPVKVPDTLVFVNGEKLTGELEKANGGGVTFKSDMAGEITVPWAKIKELHSLKSFAMLTARQKLTRRDAEFLVPKGVISADSKNITIASPGGGTTVPIASASLLVDTGSFDKAVLHPPTLLQGWSGAVTAGATLVRSTQNNTTFNGAISLVRATPHVDWLPARDRTILGYTQSYGTTSQTGTPMVETNIYHANAERDQYFSPRVYAFGSGTFDHNFSSQLDLEQAYGGGVGMTLLKDANQQLDFKGDIHYEREVFFDNTTNPTATISNQNIFGSTFSETFMRHLTKRGPVLNEFGSVSPAWSQSNTAAGQPNAFSAHIQGDLVFPVYKGFAFNVGAVDDYINNAPVGSNQNSSQFTTGITYTIKPR